ncbi:phosphoenolpyruvate--protein phosphotransferase [Thiorhodococcus mannitoliphagus]|uniref:phosphoenolpyruvate--protein phosphotransferase n=1 Tax=Thiorhodococcus mannitoliphagus TaxID=329406 RepID=A0A6P1DKV2_9GAMM|nr:phosphoenolpyruvate--protein phosphotransferase [Thiorhodococcus mannitoliphagus]NEX18857.1 phosphoenolpyruvate--protein phosphotransferase [Thiorhodococcus mannitoliphagus]
MLDALRRIVQEVNNASDLEQALTIIVRRVKQAVGADVCSVYLNDFDNRRHVLHATEGLRKEAVGRVRLELGRGLIGLVSERAEPINLDNASAHPRYECIIDSGEELFQGFLGAPIIQNRTVLGVLVLRQRQRRHFGEDEVTFVMTLASQLAGAITFARTSGELARLQHDGIPQRFLPGLAASPGIGIGTAVVVYPPADLDAVPDRQPEDLDAEVADFKRAVKNVANDLGRFAARTQAHLSAEDMALFDAWRLMLESDTLIDGTLSRIRAGNWSQGALRDTIAEHAKVFDNMDDAYLRERASDVRDLGRCILMHLQNQSAAPIQYPADTILVGEEISAMQIADVPRESLMGLVSTTGSGSSHVGILARGMGVPAAMGVSDLPVSRVEGREIVVDGYRGRVYVSPGPAVRSEYQRLAADDAALTSELQALRHLPAETTDGYLIPLYLNTGLVSETRPLGIEESAGVGLYRTELPFIVRDSFPGEGAQMANYRRVLELFAPRPVTIRTLDIGGDKPLPYFPMHEANPFLGWRGIRITLDHPEIFLTQVRAILRAAIGLDNLQLLLPMISTVSEVDDAIQLIQRAHDELLEEGYQVRMPPIGAMIEVPAAVYQAEALARRVDFLSVGTNDLTQYLLAVDRNNPHVAKLYNEYHPAVLRALLQILTGARLHGKEVSVCGEMAGDPLATFLLLGMGVHSLSMGAGSLLRVKKVIRSISRARAREVLKVALQCEEADAVRRLLLDALEAVGLGALVRPGR